MGARLPWLRAVLASGLVMGVSATSSVAAWTDSEYGTGTFSASRFALQATVAMPYDPAGPWVEHGSNAAELQLAAGDLRPGSARYAALGIRTTPGSTGGELHVPGATVNGTAGNGSAWASALRYRVVVSSRCDASVFSAGADYVVGGATTARPLTRGQEDPSHGPALAEATADGPGAPTVLCFEISLPMGASNSLQGSTADARWDISATSEET